MYLILLKKIIFDTYIENVIAYNKIVFLSY